MTTSLHFLLILTLALAPTLRAEEPADAKATVHKLEKEFAEAVSKNDGDAIMGKLAPDCVVITSDGAKVTRQQLESILKDGTLKFSSYVISEVEVRVYGETAVAIGRGRTKGRMQDEEFDVTERFTDVWVRKDGKWLCVSIHTSRTSE